MKARRQNLPYTKSQIYVDIFPIEGSVNPPP